MKEEGNENSASLEINFGFRFLKKEFHGFSLKCYHTAPHAVVQKVSHQVQDRLLDAEAIRLLLGA